MYRKLAILEPLAVFGLIVAYIWGLRAMYPNLWIAILGLMLLSHLLHGESPGLLGFGTRNLQGVMREIAPPLAFLALLMLACGILLRTIRPISVDGAVVALAGYLPWGLLQQYILNGYFLNRLDAVLSPRAAVVITAMLFCAAHAPNWFLMGVTLPGSYWATRVYQRRRNLYVMGLAHAIVGFLLFLVVPDSITHHLRVGPAWFSR
ncbi:MAG TPA: CPBP family intramembrane glutamic endopeptidase [Bryobacteraceae bacterium]|nr:CPBP family intramembrane glutamic endopeptidase [Bryobacteraceae bacterium]